MRVRAITIHNYGIPMIKRYPGEIYEMEDRDVEIMKAVGHIKPMPELKDARAGEPKRYQRRDMKA